jgi:hypothetical protein
MPFSTAFVCPSSSNRSPSASVTPSTTPPAPKATPDASVPGATATARTGVLNTRPRMAASTYCLLAASLCWLGMARFVTRMGSAAFPLVKVTTSLLVKVRDARLVPTAMSS